MTRFSLCVKPRASQRTFGGIHGRSVGSTLPLALQALGQLDGETHAPRDDLNDSDGKDESFVDQFNKWSKKADALDWAEVAAARAKSAANWQIYLQKKGKAFASPVLGALPRKDGLSPKEYGEQTEKLVAAAREKWLPLADEKVNFELSARDNHSNEVPNPATQCSIPKIKVSDRRKCNAQSHIAETEASNSAAQSSIPKTEVSNPSDRKPKPATEVSNSAAPCIIAQTKGSNSALQKPKAKTKVSNPAGSRKRNARSYIAETEASKNAAQCSKAQTEVSNSADRKLKAATEVSNSAAPSSIPKAEVSNPADRKPKPATEVSNSAAPCIIAQTKGSNSGLQKPKSKTKVSNPAGSKKRNARSYIAETEALKNAAQCSKAHSKGSNSAAQKPKAETKVSYPAGSQNFKASRATQSPIGETEDSYPAESQKFKVKGPESMELAPSSLMKMIDFSGGESWITGCRLWKGNKEVIRDIANLDMEEWREKLRKGYCFSCSGRGVPPKFDSDLLVAQAVEITLAISDSARRNFEKDAKEFLSLNGITDVPAKALAEKLEAFWNIYIPAWLVWFGSQPDLEQNSKASFDTLFFGGLGLVDEPGKKKILEYFLRGRVTHIDLIEQDIRHCSLLTQARVFEKMVETYLKHAGGSRSAVDSKKTHNVSVNFSQLSRSRPDVKKPAAQKPKADTEVSNPATRSPIAKIKVSNPARSRKRKARSHIAKAEAPDPAAQCSIAETEVSNPAGSQKSKVKVLESIELATVNQTLCLDLPSKESWITECHLWKGKKELIRDIANLDMEEWRDILSSGFCFSCPSKGVPPKFDSDLLVAQGEEIACAIRDSAPRNFEKDAMDFLSRNDITDVPPKALAEKLEDFWNVYIPACLVWFGSQPDLEQNSKAYFSALFWEGLGLVTEPGKKKILDYYLSERLTHIELIEQDIRHGSLITQANVFQHMVETFLMRAEGSRSAVDSEMTHNVSGKFSKMAQRLSDSKNPADQTPEANTEVSSPATRSPLAKTVEVSDPAAENLEANTAVSNPPAQCLIAKTEVSNSAESKNCRASPATQSPIEETEDSYIAGSQKFKIKDPGSLELATSSQMKVYDLSNKESWITGCRLWKGNKEVIRDIANLDMEEWRETLRSGIRFNRLSKGHPPKFDSELLVAQGQEIACAIRDSAPRNFEKDAMDFLSINGITDVPPKALAEKLEDFWHVYVTAWLIWFGSQPKLVQNSKANFNTLFWGGLGLVTETGRKKILEYFLRERLTPIDFIKEEIRHGSMFTQANVFQRMVETFLRHAEESRSAINSEMEQPSVPGHDELGTT